MSCYLPTIRRWELRLIAHISNDEAMLEAFQKGLDIHTQQRGFYGVPLEEVTSDQRRFAAKRSILASFMGLAPNLSQQLGIKDYQAKLIDNYFQRIFRVAHLYDQYSGKQPETRDTLKPCWEDAAICETSIPEMAWCSMSERVAINTPVQGPLPIW